MSAYLLDGKVVSSRIRTEVLEDALEVAKSLGRKPGLAVVLVGGDPASKVYVAAKSKAAEQCGLEVFDFQLPDNVSQQELESVIRSLNGDERVDGILLQLPLPKGLDEFSALSAIEPRKDVDGLHPVTQGLLLRGVKSFVPCTPQGCMSLIDEAVKELGIQLQGKRAIVVGRSILVGKPVALLLLERGCTVTIAHSKTADLPGECRAADVLVAAIGRAEFIKGEWIKPGSIVIDVGINRLADGKLTGDVQFYSAREVAAAITPVPGGVGPMTITMLLKNTVASARNKLDG
jgi:methylenetetrahydrofolate dehydrogenase (NADP+) / methenyltetrahydrofolate cyclohydrolase